MRGLKNRVVVITGGAGDIGSASARRLAEEGAKPYLLDVLDADAGRERSHAAHACEYIQCSQTDRRAVDEALARIAGSEGRLDVLIINAARTSAAGILEMDMQEWRDIVDLNLHGPAECAQSALKLMIEQERDETGIRGRILFTGSQCQERPEHGGVAYQVTKRALRRFMEQLAYDYAAEGILANMVVPGILDAGLTRRLGYSTRPESRQILLDRIPLGELGTVEQVAAAFTFLCSGDSAYMTGACLVADGGCVLGRAERSAKMG